jgi:hypothetical protein
MRPSLADYEADRFAPGTKKEAKRRKAHANHVPRVHTSVREFAQLICCAAARFGPDPLARVPE